LQITLKEDQPGHLGLPSSLCRRYGLEPGQALLLEKTASGLALHPLRPDVRKVYLEVTTRCNLECRTCVRNVWDEPLEDMDEATFERVVFGLRALPELREVVVGGYGEPLAHPGILDYLAAMKDLGIKVTVSTNGVQLDKERAGVLVDLGVDGVTVSLDGTDPETYADVRRGAALRAVLENVEVLNERKGEMGTSFPRVAIEFVALKRNRAQLADLPALARRLGANRVIVTHLLPHTDEMAEEILYGRDARPPLPAVVGWPARGGDWLLWGTMELPRMNWGAERRCRFVGSNALVVGWDGGVSPCYALSHSYPYTVFGRRKEVTRYTFGNVNETDLTAIWTSDDYVRFRAEVRRFNFPSCVDCDLRESCDITESNNGCWGWCPSCADCLWAQDIVRCP
jgi:tungsten cofactor oxidoreducase radical SAM maturase